MKTPLCALVLALSISLPAVAQTGHAHHGHHGGHHASPPTAKADAPAPFAEGTVRRVHSDENAVTIAHGPLEALGMPPMTMRFDVSDSALLEGLSVGQTVRFQVVQRGEAFVVTAIEKTAP